MEDNLTITNNKIITATGNGIQHHLGPTLLDELEVGGIAIQVNGGYVMRPNLTLISGAVNGTTMMTQQTIFASNFTPDLESTFVGVTFDLLFGAPTAAGQALLLFTGDSGFSAPVIKVQLIDNTDSSKTTTSWRVLPLWQQTITGVVRQQPYYEHFDIKIPAANASVSPHSYTCVISWVLTSSAIAAWQDPPDAFCSAVYMYQS